MGVFEFTWPYQAGQVFITGTFDEWKGSIKLRKNEAGLFTVLVNLGDTEKVYYKYIVDGNWTVNQEARKEYDSSGNENNVLYPEDLRTPTPSIKERAVCALPGQPITGNETPPMLTPGLDDLPGGFPETPVQEVNGPEILSVNPFPASTTAGNPITLQPGEAVPSVISQSVDDTVHLDKESYEKADASNFGVGAEPPVLPPVVTPAAEREANGTGVLDVPEITSIEISAPVAAAEVPEIVKESQEQAQVPPEASAVPEAVEAKKEVEREIESVVPEAPATVIPEPTEDEEIPAASVPDVVKESQALAHVSPEASASQALVEKKAELEQELIAQPPHLQASEVEEAKPIVTADKPAEVLAPVVLAAPVAESTENHPPATNGTRSISPTMSPLTTPAAPTTHVYTASVPGATFNSSPKAEPAPSTKSSSASSRESHNEKRDLFKEKAPEKKKEKRRSVILGRILNLFK